MGKKNDIPMGIFITLGLIIIFLIYYFYRLVTFTDYSVFFEMTLRAAIIWADIFLSIILIIFGIYGLYKGKSWARYYLIFYLLWSSLWAIVMIYNKVEIIEHYIFFIIYVLILIYLMMSDTITFVLSPGHVT